MKLRDEFLEFLQIRFSRIKTILTFAVPAGVSIWFYISNATDYAWVTIYAFVVYLLFHNSLHILFAREKLPDIELTVEKQARNLSVPTYRLLIPYGWGGLILACGLIVAFCFVSPLNVPVNHAIYGTPTLTPTITALPTITLTPTSTSTQTPTSTQTFTPTPKAQGVYYMIIVDASKAMQDAFDGQTKWDAAKNTAASILQNFEPGSSYGLIVVGGEQAPAGVDACNEPSSLKVPFSPRSAIANQISQLQPVGGGSLSSAFALAQNQFAGLDDRTVRVMVYITGSSDACSRDEWRDLQSYLKTQSGSIANLHAEIIALDADGKLAAQNIPQALHALVENVNIQTPQNMAALQQVSGTAVDAINAYIQETINNFPTLTPIPSATPSPTSRPVTPSMTPTITLTPSTTPTFGAPTAILTWTPSVTPVTPSATSVGQTSVQLLAVNYVNQGIGCQVDVQVQVTGGAATGVFHVRNDSYSAGTSSVSPQATLPVGANYASAYSLSNLLTLGGNQPAYYQHEVWFEYDGKQSNHLTGLICPNIPPP